MNQMSISNNDITQAAAMPHMENHFAFIAASFPAIKGKATSVRAKPTTTTRVLRHRVTGLYFCDGHWTKDPFQATGFIDGLEAAQACAGYDLTEVDLSIHLGTSAHALFSTPLR